MPDPRKILVADDEPDTVAFLCAWLEDQGYLPCFERDSERILDTALRERPALLLLDVNMPGQSGIQVYREIRASESLSELPIIFVTGAGDFGLFSQACSPLPEPAARIEKPIDLALLEGAIRKALAGSPKIGPGPEAGKEGCPP